MLMTNARGLMLWTAMLSSSAGLSSGGALTIEQLINIRHPSNPIFSPDSQKVAFLWDRAGVVNLYLADAASRVPQPHAVTNFPSGQVAGPFWSHDGQTLYFSRGGDLWQVPVAGGEPRPVWTTAAPKTNIVPSPDGTRVAFLRSSGPGAGVQPGTSTLFVRTLADGKETQVVSDLVGAGGVSWSPEGTSLAYSVTLTIRHDEAPAYSGAKIIYTITERAPSQTFVVKAAGGTPTPIGMPGGFGGLRWIDSRRVAFDRQSSDFKRRTTYVSDVAGGEPRIVHEDRDEKFWSLPGDSGAGAQPSPDGRFIAFVSDRDGWDHLYVTPSVGGEAIQITKGRFEAWRPVWSRDSTRIAFDANEPDRPGTRHVGIATIAGDPGHSSVRMITTGRGADIAAGWSPDGKRLVFQHSDARTSADLFVVDAGAGASPVRLSDSLPAGVDREALVDPQLVHYAGPDGQQVPAYLFVPKGLERSQKHPAIVWIHGDGVNQNYDGWHVQRNYAIYYSFHQYLLQKGYVVLAPDYRGSIGYGKAWRQGVYMDVGGNDYRDAAMAANHLRTLPYVDGDRIGVWGLSYGGFFTLIALTDQPKLFRCGVDVAGVADYVMYYHDPYHGAWTASRIGSPSQNPTVYAQASPLSHVDRLERPLLVLHGTADVNVPYLHSVRLVDELLKHGKGNLISFMTYPGEFHYFQREHVLADAWHRVESFFDTNLRGGVAPAN